MIKLVEIARAWISAANPTDVEKEIAESRIKICQGCPSQRLNEAINVHYCGECGCPLSKKIFSPLPGEKACPLKKWPK
jgi:hypothetical protein